jgi:hypothetical protein
MLIIITIASIVRLNFFFQMALAGFSGHGDENSARRVVIYRPPR